MQFRLKGKCSDWHQLRLLLQEAIDTPKTGATIEITHDENNSVTIEFGPKATDRPTRLQMELDAIVMESKYQ